jgi:aminoglycoside/choline kinase family phosphotransferase
MKQSKYPLGWNEERVQHVLAHYEQQSEDEAVAEDESAFQDSTQTVMGVPRELVPAIRELIAKHMRRSTT